ncbi:MAG: hypothetical protein QW395_07805, partial [Candidatus Nitrosotenuis sp.]
HDIQKKKENVVDFEPNPKVLPKIIKILFEEGQIGRTALSLKTKINYQVLSKHVIWLQRKGLIEFEIVGGKLLMKLTESGREFAQKLASIPY